MIDSFGKDYFYTLDDILDKGLEGDETLLNMVREKGTQAAYRSLWHFAQWQTAFESLASFEENARGGVQYDYVGFARLDIGFLMAHPPLHIIEQARNEGCWHGQPFVLVQDGEDYQGVNDRYFFTDRQRGAEVVGGFWETITQKDRLMDVRNVLHSLYEDVDALIGEWGPESLANVMLIANTTCVKRFTGAAVLTSHEGSLARHQIEAMTVQAFAKMEEAGGVWDYVPFGQEYLRGGRCFGLPYSWTLLKT